MLYYYQGPSTSNIWEGRLKHQQFSRWVSSLARRDERSCCSPPADSPVIGLCRHRATVSRAARPVMWMRWQESRQVPSEPPGAGQQWFSVWPSWLAQCVLYCCWTVQPSQGKSVRSWCKFSPYTSVSPSVTHLFLLSLSLSSLFFFCVLFLSLSLFSCVSFSLANCFHSPLSSPLLTKRFRSRWHRLKRGRTLLRPPYPQPRVTPVFLTGKPH